jgi:hypothetical protein
MLGSFAPPCFAPNGGLRYGFSIAAPVVIAHIANSVGVIVGKQMGLRYNNRRFVKTHTYTDRYPNPTTGERSQS